MGLEYFKPKRITKKIKKHKTIEKITKVKLSTGVAWICVDVVEVVIADCIEPEKISTGFGWFVEGSYLK